MLALTLSVFSLSACSIGIKPDGSVSLNSKDSQGVLSVNIGGDSGVLKVEASIAGDNSISVNGYTRKARTNMSPNGISESVAKAVGITSIRPYHLITLWQDQAGIVWRDEYEIGRRFEPLLKGRDPLILNQVNGDNGSIVVFVERKITPVILPTKPPTATPIPPTPAPQSPTGAAGAIVAETPTVVFLPTVELNPTNEANANPTRRPTPRPATAQPQSNIPAFPASSACPRREVCISSPGAGSTVRGTVTLFGTAIHDNFSYYKFELLDGRCTNGVCHIASLYAPVYGGALLQWDTRRIPNGRYLLRLAVIDRNGGGYPQVAVISVNIAN
ncbi:MAG: hypothetical protein KIH69_003975 [Anaerolineae bacterium]|nr:hypothetical protein [Anaerolineae bacterium]